MDNSRIKAERYNRIADRKELTVRPDWLFDENEAKELARRFSSKFMLFVIENPTYKGYGLVIDL